VNEVIQKSVELHGGSPVYNESFNRNAT